jgi:hypothetical protein
VIRDDGGGEAAVYSSGRRNSEDEGPELLLPFHALVGVLQVKGGCLLCVATQCTQVATAPTADKAPIYAIGKVRD